MEICSLTATEMARRVRAKEVLAVEVMEAHLAQIDRLNKEVNAIVTLLPERAMDGARTADDILARGSPARSAARASTSAQGSRLDKGHPNHVRLARLQRFRA